MWLCGTSLLITTSSTRRPAVISDVGRGLPAGSPEPTDNATADGVSQFGKRPREVRWRLPEHALELIAHSAPRFARGVRLGRDSCAGADIELKPFRSLSALHRSMRLRGAGLS